MLIGSASSIRVAKKQICFAVSLVPISVSGQEWLKWSMVAMDSATHPVHLGLFMHLWSKFSAQVLIPVGIVVNLLCISKVFNRLTKF
jgi:hypothetical protein